MRNTNKILIWTFGFLLALALALVPSVALANAIFPLVLILLSLPFVPALLLIIAIEAVVYHQLLSLKLEDALLCSICTNLVSTIGGYSLLVVASIFCSSAPTPTQSLCGIIMNPFGLGVTAITSLLIVAYFLSVFIEFFVIKYIFLLNNSFNHPVKNQRLVLCAFISNLATYIPLAILILLSLR